LRNGTDKNLTGPGGRTAMMLAAFNGHTKVVEMLLDAGARVDTRDAIGRTALMYAATGPNLPTIKLLLEEGARADAVDGQERWTPLMFAAAEGHLHVVKLLLAEGADPDTRDTDGETAADFAARRGHQAVASLLQAAER